MSGEPSLAKVEVGDSASLMAMTNALLAVDDTVRPSLAVLRGHVADFVAAAGTDRQAKEACTRVTEMYGQLETLLTGLGTPLTEIGKIVNDLAAGVVSADRSSVDAMNAVHVPQVPSSDGPQSPVPASHTRAGRR